MKILFYKMGSFSISILFFIVANIFVLTYGQKYSTVSPSDPPQEHVLINVNHIVDFLQTMKKSQDELDKRIETLSQSKSQDEERSKLDKKLSSLALQVSKIESSLPSKIDELLVKRLNEMKVATTTPKPKTTATERDTQAEEPIKLDTTLFQIEQPFTPPPLYPTVQFPRSSQDIVFHDPFRATGAMQSPLSQSHTYYSSLPSSIYENGGNGNNGYNPNGNGNGNGNGNDKHRKTKKSDVSMKLETFKRRIAEVERSLQTVGKITNTTTRVYHSSQMDERVSQNEKELQSVKQKQGQLQRAIDTVLIHFSTIVNDVERVEERLEGCGCSNGTGAGGSKKKIPLSFEFEEDLRRVFIPPVTPTQTTSTSTTTTRRPTTITTPTEPEELTTTTTSTMFPSVWDELLTTTTEENSEMSFYDEWEKRSSEERFGREPIAKDVNWLDAISAEREEPEPENMDFGTYAFLKPPPADKKGAPMMLRDEGVDKSGQRVRRDLSFLAKILKTLSHKVENQRQQINQLSSQLVKVNVTHALLLQAMSHETLKRTIRPKDCSEVKLLQKLAEENENSSLSKTKNSGFKKLIIFPKHDDQSVQVICDMDTEGGGWTLIQRRGHPLKTNSARENFYRNWTEYEKGFGSMDGDFWLGLEHIAALTKLSDQELRIELTNWEEETRVARYNFFQVEDETNLYRLKVAGYSGDAGDSFSRHNSMAFSTMDQDHDTDPHRNCAQMWKGAWWYYGCHESNLNGLYGKEGSNGTHEFGTGIVWFHWTGNYYSLKNVEIKIRNRFLQRTFTH